MSLTFGADPELFLCDEGDQPVVAVGKIGGTKEKPLMVDGYGLQEDNVMGEFTMRPTTDSMVLLERGVSGTEVLLDHVRQNTGKQYGLWRSPVAKFSEKELLAAGPQAMQFGCSPDFDAYEMGAPHPRVNPDRLLTKQGALRFAGGHIHIGYKDHLNIPEHVFVLFCDLTIGASLMWYGESQGERRKLYGMPGRYRPTAYGVEYRTPSNYWLYNRHIQQGLMSGLGSLSRLANMPQDVLLRLYNEVPWNDLKEMIIAEDRDGVTPLGTWLNNSYDNLALSYGG